MWRESPVSICQDYSSVVCHLTTAPSMGEPWPLWCWGPGWSRGWGCGIYNQHEIVEFVLFNLGYITNMGYITKICWLTFDDLTDLSFSGYWARYLGDLIWSSSIWESHGQYGWSQARSGELGTPSFNELDLSRWFFICPMENPLLLGIYRFLKQIQDELRP